MVGPNRPGDSYVHLPDSVRDEGDGSVFTFCWLDHNRHCSGGCEAFDTAHAGDETGTWTSCRLINLAHAVGHAVVSYVRPKPLESSKIPGQDIPPPRTGL